SDAEEYLEYLDATLYRPDCANIDLDITRRRLEGACVSGGCKGSFLHRVASMPMGRRTREESGLDIGCEDLVVEAKRIIASEVCEFRAPTERSKPYVRWLRRLTEEDTVVTFNYDCVPERL